MSNPSVLSSCPMKSSRSHHFDCSSTALCYLRVFNPPAVRPFIKDWNEIFNVCKYSSATVRAVHAKVRQASIDESTQVMFTRKN